MSEPTYHLRQGSGPLLVSMPHLGTAIPAEVEATMTGAAARRDDTDWHLDILYDCLDQLGASVLTPVYSRYLVDLNRPPDGALLYPGQANTPVCPLDTFDGAPLYRPGRTPDAAEIERRLPAYWHPYHAALAQELARLRAAHGIALLWDAHSVRSVVPRLFEGRLPDINLGTAHGRSCRAGLGERLLAIAKADSRYSAVLNGRFVGGHITRAHGQPERGVHAVQLELTQLTYMQEAPPYAFDQRLADGIRPLLKAFLEAMLAWAKESANN